MPARFRFLIIVALGLALTAATAALTPAQEPTVKARTADTAVSPPGDQGHDAPEAPSEHERHAAAHGVDAQGAAVDTAAPQSMVEEFWYNFTHNLFKPLLLFFYMGFLIPLFKVEFEFPNAIYQGLTLYLLIAIGWKGGEELAEIKGSALGGVFGFMLVGFLLNFIIGVLAYVVLKLFTRLREVDRATVAGYYGSDSAGTFATCVGVLGAAVPLIKYDAYMPVMLAIMEIPGCLVALYLVSRLRHTGMDALGNMPYEPGYNPSARRPVVAHAGAHGEPDPVGAEVDKLAMEDVHKAKQGEPSLDVGSPGFLSPKLLHEVFLNPGLYLLFGGIFIGFLSRLQGEKVTAVDDPLFLNMFQGVLCLFLLEMGMTASRKMKDLKTAGWQFIAFGLVMPNVFATLGITVAHVYSMVTGVPFELGTYVLFAVLCGASSYIAVPAVQRLAIPEASPTLPLAASLGLTFSYNVTIGIPLYIQIAKAMMNAFRV